MPAIEILLKALGVDSARSGIKSVGDEAERLGDRVEGAGTRAEQLTGKLESIRNGAAAVAAVGAATLVLSNHLSNSFLEADRLGGKLESMMKGKGLEQGIEQVRTLGNEIAGLTGGDDDQVSTAIAGAIASGRLNGLREYGIVIDAVGQQAIEAAGKISDSAKQQEIFNQVMRAGGEAAQNLRAGMSDSTAALGEMSVRWGNLEEGIGEGSANVKAAIYENVISPIFDLLEASPGLQQTVGGFLEIGGAAMSVGGSVIGLGAQLGMLAMSFPVLSAQGVAAFTAIRASATAATVGFNLATAGVTAIAVAAALTVGWVAYAVGQHIGEIDKEQSYLDRLTAGWLRLKGIITGEKVEFAQNERDLESEIANRKAANSKAVLSGTKTQAQADEDNRNFEITVRESFAREQLRIGDSANMTKNQEAAARLKQQQSLTSSLALPALPSTAMPSTPLVTPSALSTSAAPTMADMMPATGSVSSRAAAGGTGATSLTHRIRNTATNLANGSVRIQFQADDIVLEDPFTASVAAMAGGF
jgi:hypothetical protein